MSLLKEAKGETTPAKPIPKNVTLKSIPVKIKTSPKWHALPVTSSIFPGTPPRSIEAGTKTENKIWNPGRSTIIQVNSHLHLIISTVEIRKLNSAEESDNEATSETQVSDSRTELDFHANMPVVVQNCYILYDSWNFAEANAFSPEYEEKNFQ